MKTILFALLLLVTVAAPGQSRRLLIASAKVSGPTYNPATDTHAKQWWKADALALSDGALVAAWTASAAGGATASVSVDSNKPIYLVNVKSGLPAIFFAGVSNYLQTSAFTPIAQGFSLYVVFQFLGTVSDAANDRLLAPIGGTAGEQVFIAKGALPANYAIYAGNGASLTSADAADNNWHTAEFIFNGASSTYKLDGNTVATFAISPGGDAIKGLTIGADYDSGAAWTGYIGEIIIRDVVSTSGETVAIFAYERNRWHTY